MWLKIPIVFHNGSNYDYHSIIKLPEDYCLGENTENCITFTVPIKREVTKIDKNYKNYILYIKIYLQRKTYGKLIIKSCE